MKYYVYRHTNLTNGKSYIGVTGLKPEKRWNNGQGYRAQPKFFNAIVKYGWDGFDHEILAVCPSEEVAYETEKALIKKYDCISNGYNVSKGGRNMVCATERIPVDRYDLDTGDLICTYPSIADAANDLGVTDSHISECCRGKHKTAAGYGWAYHGDDYKKPTKCQRFSKIKQLNPLTWEVIAIYESQREAAKAVGVSPSLINLCCKGKAHTGGGYAWRYAK